MGGEFLSRVVNIRLYSPQGIFTRHIKNYQVIICTATAGIMQPGIYILMIRFATECFIDCCA